jgi:tetratricopeptide (TPR) repeat protein
VHGLDHASSFGIYFAAGRLFSIRKNFDRSLDFFSKAWQVKEKDTEDQSSIDLADVHREIAYIHSQKDDLLDSQSHLREAYKIVKSHDDTSDDVLIDILVDLVDVDGKLHSQSTQLEYANEAIHVIKRRQEEEKKMDWNLSLLIHLKEIVVDIHREMGSLEKSMGEMEETCVLIKSAYGGRDIRYADACWKLADMCKEDGDEEIAVELYRKATR